MTKYVEAASPTMWTTISRRTATNVVVVGALVGLITYALFVLFYELILQPLLCSRDGIISCENSVSLANVLSVTIATVIGLVFLVREQVFRPLLIVLAAALSLGGLMASLVAVPWYAVVVITVALYALAYALYTWLAQTTHVVTAIASTLVLVALARLVLAL